jgi:two-component system, LytTR family, sensor kinase
MPNKREFRPFFMHPLFLLCVWMTLALMFAIQEYAAMRAENYKVPFRTEINGWGLLFLLWAVTCQGMWWFLGSDIQQTQGWRRILGFYAPLSLAIGAAQLALYVACLGWLHVATSKASYGRRLAFHLYSDLISNIVIFWIIFLLFRGIGYYQKYREREFTASQLEIQLVNAKLRVLRMQLNPHFLFNTMNSVSSLMRSDVDAADEMLERLSSLLRMSLDRGDAQQVTLHQEMEFVQMYLSIQDLRFAGVVTQHIDIPAELLDALVPSMILQPIVENAYVHGLARATSEATLNIEASGIDGDLRLHVRNSGGRLQRPELDTRSREGVGIANVKARLALHFGDEQSFSLHELPTGEVEAILLLPLRFSPRLNDHSAGHLYVDSNRSSGR